ncbi:Alpha/Beta hydrolase protein [Boletus reticuloceps]|uniref:Carboxypeptidase n=1 Tax=Boletus reticuloceps TaxID=495285 RepID=A0A8I2YMT2_9AGAM|nr:Alpha/Beta hydrolase protein [Boletus reticuloceps]
MSWVSCVSLLLSASTLSSFTFALAQAQQPGNTTQDSWPHVYPGMPTGDYCPEWQKYFQVTESLPNVTFPLARNWAGNIAVQRPGHPNNTLFFWAFESSDGSFTDNSDKPWAIWLNGGPGASSLFGLFIEVCHIFLVSSALVVFTCAPQNGPLHITSNYSVVENKYAWSTVADYVWIDQPVCVYILPFLKVDSTFMGFLDNFVKVFPNLARRPLYLTGESYAGTYIPYITKAYFEMDKPPVNLARIAIGDGVLGSIEEFLELPVITVLETYPQIIGYDPQVFEYFQEQSTLCGYNLTLQYPQPEHFPSLNAPVPFSSSGLSIGYDAKLTKRQLMLEIEDRLVTKLRAREGALLARGERRRARNTWKRNLAGLPNGTIDPYYECDLWDEMVDYAVNFTFPWSSGRLFDPYNVPDALSPEASTDASVFLNDNRTRAAIHAPTSKNWADITPVVFAPTNGTTNAYGDPSVEPMAFLTDLATNATAHDLKIIVYSGNDDSLVPHFGSQIAIQNTTFAGVQGFTRRPETPWSNDNGEFAGIVHQERGWTYVLVAHAGHLLAYNNPISALTLAREFIFGDNSTGLVTSSGTVIGDKESSLGDEILRGQAGIYYGQATTASTYFFPSATVEAWYSYVATATATAKAGTPNVG